MAQMPTSLPPNAGSPGSSGPAQLTVQPGKALQDLAGLKLQVGKIYPAQIERVEGQKVQFTLAGKAMTAQSNLPLQAGTTVNVKVAQTQPTVVLQVQIPKDNAQQLAAQSAYRQLLPNQTPVNQGLQQLMQLSQSPALPAVIQTTLSQLLEQLFRPNANLTAQQLKHQLQNTGLFLENRLSQSRQPPTADFKARLLQLGQLLLGLKDKNADIEQLSKTVNQTLNRLTLQQLNAAQNPHLINIELPLHPDSRLNPIEIDIRRQGAAHDPLWEVMVALTLPDGQFKARLIYHREQLNAGLWADQDALKQTLTEQLPALKTQFQEAGLPLNQLFIAHQEPSPDQGAQKVALIDIHI
ncbi:flagellar hook-length control protein FliK [Hydrogenovibrio halophilus]|uniref:flagellar hook-length control protein FliK n=1 Tax=Hydrogenovibrio halophilus TaxID=373391 RepID=UPI00036BEE4C|nr:flagellar hook-length control protein FliK [Hydrogenovibrio halophilus]